MIAAGHRDRILLALLWTAAIPSGLLVAAIAAFLLVEALPALRTHGLFAFLTDARWQPTNGQVGLAPMLAGSLAVTGGALLLALPLALACAGWLHAYAPRALAGPLRRLLELLAGLPSVVLGLWGLTSLVPLLGRWAPTGSGQSLLAGALVLALMLLPLLALGTLSSLTAVPADLRQGGAALGLGRWCILRRIEWPEARSGIATAGILATGRALGETMVVALVCGNVVQVPDGLLAPLRTLTANIAVEMGYASAGHRSILVVSGLFLLALVAALVSAAHLIGRGKNHD